MNIISTVPAKRDVAHEHRGDLYRDGEDLSDTADRVRAHLRNVLPDMDAKVQIQRNTGSRHIRVAITRYKTPDLSDRTAGFAAKRLVDAELDRFSRYDWCPLHGMLDLSHSSNTSIDPSLHAAALDGAPEIEPLVSFAEFTRTARRGDLLKYVAGKELPQGDCVMITAISPRRLTTCPASPETYGRDTRVPIQGGACFISDGNLVCFKHSGFAHQGGYSLVRWMRQP
jgi:hypothetical protein